jgi:hypothetical protein
MRILVDETTGTRFVRWFETKNGMVDPTCATLHQWSTKGMKTLFIRCGGAGENHSLEETLHSSQWKMPIEFEYTARNTPPTESSRRDWHIRYLLSRASSNVQGKFTKEVSLPDVLVSD